jgi:hypothetical protein
MKKIAVLLILCLLVPTASACDAEPVSASDDEVSVDIMAIKTHAGKLVDFIDEFVALIEDFEVRPRTDAPTLCTKMELLYREFKEETPPGELAPAQDQVLKGARAYLDGAWDWTVSEEKPGVDVRKKLREDFLKLKSPAE